MIRFCQSNITKDFSDLLCIVIFNFSTSQMLLLLNSLELINVTYRFQTDMNDAQLSTLQKYDVQPEEQEEEAEEETPEEPVTPGNNNTALIIGLSVGIPCGILVIAAIVVAVVMVQKKKKADIGLNDPIV